MRRALLLLSLAVTSSAAPSRCDLAVGHLTVLPPAGPFRTWERVEIDGWLTGPVDNPFDPAEVDLWGEFVGPDAALHRVPAFFAQAFERRLVGGFEKLAPRGTPLWKVRFTPTAAGRWRWRWTGRGPAGVVETGWHELGVGAPAPDRHGFLRVSPEDPRFLRFDDGTSWFAVGENLSWYDGRGTFAYDDWLAKLAAEGANYVRLWMPSWAFGLEWIDRDASGAVLTTSLGDYTSRLDRAWQLDHVIETAERHGIQVMLCIQNHGPFSLTANSEWADNPYNQANGGPLAAPEDLFTDPRALELFERRLRYVVARWSSAPNLLAWELWNEVDLAGGVSPEVIDWHARMAEVLREFDPNDHLVTTSVSPPTASPLFTLDEIDFVQLHSYAYPFTMDFSAFFPFFVAAATVPGKPILISEFGTDWRGPAETLVTDPRSQGFHDGLWVGALSGTFGTAMTWWWDNVVDPEDLYGHFGAVARFVDGVAFDREGFVRDAASAAAPGRTLRALSLRGASTALAWLKDLDSQYWMPLPASPRIENATLTWQGLGDGHWTARWFDTRSGAVLLSVDADVVGGAVVLPVPAFEHDVAVRMERDAP